MKGVRVGLVMSVSASALDANAGSRAEGANGEAISGTGAGQEASGDLKGESDIRIGS
jgi:hypothetical protein